MLRSSLLKSLAALLLILAAAGCTRALFVPPAGPGTPAPNALAAWTEATAGCRDAKSFAAMLRVSGRVGSARVWPITIEAAVTSDQSIYLSATASGTSLFVVAGTANRATLWLRREERVVTAAPADLMDAIVGVPIAPAQLLAVLTGCATRAFDVKSAAQHGAILAVHTSDARVFLQSIGGSWRTRAAQADGFTVEFGRKAGPAPSDVWIWSTASRTPAASIHLSITDGEVNGQIPASIFQIPAGAAAAAAMTLEELRAASPWRERSSSQKDSAWPAR